MLSIKNKWTCGQAATIGRVSNNCKKILSKSDLMFNFKKIIGASSIALSLSFAGCASFPAGHVPTTSFSAISVRSKPVVYVDVMAYAGSPESPSPLPAAVPVYREITNQAFVDSRLFKMVTMNPSDKEKADLHVEVKLYEKNHPMLALFTGIVDYATLSVVPGFTYVSSAVQMNVLDKDGNVVSTSTREDSADQIWGLFGLLAYPFASDNLPVVANRVMTNEVEAALKEQYQQGHLNVDLSDKAVVKNN